jgi:hypothetical protein
MRSSEHAIDFLRALTGLAERLAARDVVVGELRSHWSAFGSWELHATSGVQEERRADALRRGAYREPGPDVLRVTWDGRDRTLRVQLSPTTATAMLNKWESKVEQRLESFEQAIRFAEEYVARSLR